MTKLTEFIPEEDNPVGTEPIKRTWKESNPWAEVNREVLDNNVDYHVICENCSERFETWGKAIRHSTE